MKRLTRIDAAHQAAIDQATDRFGDHEGTSRARVLAWVAQFSDEDLNVASKVLRQVRYYDAANIRAMTRQLVRIVRDEFKSIDARRIVFLPVGKPGSSANVIARVLTQLRDGPRINVITMADLEHVDPRTVSVIVFIDDFSGTGQQLSEWWANVEPLVRPKRAIVAVALLVLNGIARPRIEQFARALCVDELDETANVLSAASAEFEVEEKDVLVQYCERTGSSADYIHGRGGCGLLLAFKHGCPNNSLPILWWEGKAWRPLFKRHAI